MTANPNANNRLLGVDDIGDIRHSSKQYVFIIIVSVRSRSPPPATLWGFIVSQINQPPRVVGGCPGVFLGRSAHQVSFIDRESGQETRPQPLLPGPWGGDQPACRAMSTPSCVWSSHVRFPSGSACVCALCKRLLATSGSAPYFSTIRHFYSWMGLSISDPWGGGGACLVCHARKTSR